MRPAHRPLRAGAIGVEPPSIIDREGGLHKQVASEADAPQLADRKIVVLGKDQILLVTLRTRDQ